MLSSSSLFTSPADSVDDYAAQIETFSSDIIHQLAPHEPKSFTTRSKKTKSVVVR